MRLIPRLLLLVGVSSAAFLTSCETTTTASHGGAYRVTAHRPHDPSKVEVKLSTSTQNLYVMEGDRLLMAAQGNVGKAGSETPKGNFTIYNKIKNKRRISQPDAGYPMAYWCEFKPAYGFHEGFVHPVPRTHGCVRLHREAAARLYALDWDRHPGANRNVPSRGQQIRAPGPQARSKPRSRSTAVADDVRELVQRPPRPTPGGLTWSQKQTTSGGVAARGIPV